MKFFLPDAVSEQIITTELIKASEIVIWYYLNLESQIILIVT